MLNRHGKDFVAKGLVCEMIKVLECPGRRSSEGRQGTSGLESSHWKRRILLLNQYGMLPLMGPRACEGLESGEVWLASMNQLLDPIQIIARNSNIVVTKLQFGSLFQSALRVDVAGAIILTCALVTSGVPGVRW